MAKLATPNQLEIIKSLGIKAEPMLSFDDAQDLIDAAMADIDSDWYMDDWGDTGFDDEGWD